MTATIVIGAIGTSIARGSGASESVGHWMKACLRESVPFVGTGMDSELAQTFVSTGHHEIRYALLGACTDIIVEHGVNDLTSNPANTFAIVAARLRALHAQIASTLPGVRIWQLTLPPSYTTSSDSFLTTAGQTLNPNRANYSAVNDWIRAGCPETGGVPVTSGGTASPYLSGFFDIADQLETSRNSGIWRANGTSAGQYTADGTHPSDVGHTAAASVINLNAIRVAAGVPIPVRNLVKVGGVPALIH